MAKAKQARVASWGKLDSSTLQSWSKDLIPKRKLLADIIGAVDPRVPSALQVIRDPSRPAPDPAGGYLVDHVRWEVFDGVHGEGLLLRPVAPARAAVIALPDADES